MQGLRMGYMGVTLSGWGGPVRVGGPCQGGEALSGWGGPVRVGFKKQLNLRKKHMDWIDQLEGNIIVCDAAANIIYMNEKARKQYAKDGGPALIGKSLFDCHNERSVAKIREIMTTHKKNVYTIEKNGLKKIIYQTPWMKSGEFKGIVELSLEIPVEMPHFVRE